MSPGGVAHSRPTADTEPAKWAIRLNNANESLGSAEILALTASGQTALIWWYLEMVA